MFRKRKFQKNDSQFITVEHNLTCNHTEADTRMFVHIKQALSTALDSVENVVLYSPDTDVFVLGISKWFELKDDNCRTLWMIVGNGEKKRGLGCHIAAENLGCKFSNSLAALHAFTGCDSTSKIATKRAIFNLAKGSESALDIVKLIEKPQLTTDEFQELEKFYLKLINKKGESCDNSRYIYFMSTPSAVSDIGCLPCTSHCFQLHVLRCQAQLYY